MLTDISAPPDNRPNPNGGPGTGIHPTIAEGAGEIPGDGPDGVGCAEMARRAASRAATEFQFQAETPSDPFNLQTIYCGDNLDKLSRMPAKCVDLIYIDPPFNSNRNYEVFWGEAKETRAFEDRHESTMAYLDFMRPRCEELRRVLKDTGSFYYHSDWHASHYVKVMLDQVFGENAFQNEIIWKRTGSHGSARRYGTVHDTIFFYTGSKRYTWNRLYQPYDIEYLNTFLDHQDADGRRWMRVSLTGDGIRTGESGKPWRGVDVTARGRHWAIPGEVCEHFKLTGLTGVIDKLDALDAAGAIHWPKKKDGVPRYKQYEDKMPGVPLQTIWSDIRPIHNLSGEREGYPTQKPLPLLERIIKTSSNPDDIVLDAFCGCGTALEAAQKLDRRWIGIDISPTACRVMSDRLRRQCALVEGRDFFVRDLPKTAEQLRAYPHFEFENWAVNALNTVLVNGRAIGNKAKVNDKGIDGRIYPIRADKTKTSGLDLFGPTDDWLPIQVKQVDVVNRDEIDTFYGAMKRKKRDKGFFISFGFSSGALKEMKRLHDDSLNGLEIIPLTVDEILAEEVRYRV